MQDNTELEKVREQYLNKKHGKCATCKFGKIGQYVPYYYCSVREEFLDSGYMYDKVMIWFCRYYSKR